MVPVDGVAAGVGGQLLDLGHRFAISLGRQEQAEPAVAESRGAPEGGVGSSADHDGHGFRRRRKDRRLLELEDAAGEVDRVAGEEGADDRERLVEATSTRSGIDTAHFELVTILTSESDTEHEPTGCELRDRRDLARHRHRVAKPQQVHAGLDRERLGERCEGGGVEQPVVAPAVVEAHVVAHDEMIDARRLRPRDCHTQRARGPARRGSAGFASRP